MSFVYRFFTRGFRVLSLTLGLFLYLVGASPLYAQVTSHSFLDSPPLEVASSSDSGLIPNDPQWEKQWYLRQIGAPRAWAMATNTRPVVVAVIDGGVDITHPDLRSNIWNNPREIPDDGIDNDGNGYVDDIHGWNFISKSNDVRPVFKRVQLEDAWSHGTMVASLLGAKGNDGIGMAGVAWNARIMPVVVLDADGSGTTSDIISAIRYAVNMGAQVINLSLAGYDRDPALEEMVKRAFNAGVTIVAATGNDDSSKRGINIDETPVYPACQDAGEDSVIGVSGTDVLDQHAAYANFGKNCTDVSAPAYGLFAARPSYPHVPSGAAGSVTSLYREGIIGTSLAAPLVSGAAAVLKSVHPDWSVVQIRNRLYETADPLEGNSATGTKGIYGYGRLNLARALAPVPAPAPIVNKATSTKVARPRSPMANGKSLR